MEQRQLYAEYFSYICMHKTHHTAAISCWSLCLCVIPKRQKE